MEVKGLTERSVYVCVHGCVYACLVLTTLLYGDGILVFRYRLLLLLFLSLLLLLLLLLMSATYYSIIKTSRLIDLLSLRVCVCACG